MYIICINVFMVVYVCLYECKCTKAGRAVNNNNNKSTLSVYIHLLLYQYTQCTVYGLYPYIQSIHFFTENGLVHCGEGQIQLTLLLRLCDSVAPLVLILCKRFRKENLSGCILVIHNIFVFLNSSSIRGVIIKNTLDFNLTRILLQFDVGTRTNNSFNGKLKLFASYLS